MGTDTENKPIQGGQMIESLKTATTAYLWTKHLYDQTKEAREAIKKSEPVTFFGRIHRYYLQSVTKNVPETPSEKSAFDTLRFKIGVDIEDFDRVKKTMEQHYKKLDSKYHPNRRKNIEEISQELEYLNAFGFNRGPGK